MLAEIKRQQSMQKLRFSKSFAVILNLIMRLMLV